MSKLLRIRERLETLRRIDIHLEVFGASTHRYQLGPVLTNQDLEAFELEFGVRLPEEYSAFLTQIGNGGAGPSYGLYSLAQVASETRKYQFTKDGHPRATSPRLDKPFPLTGSVADALRVGCRDKHTRINVHTNIRFDGIVDIVHHGCAAYGGLVVCGEQLGTVWSIHHYVNSTQWSPLGNGPGSLPFLDWYEHWLDAVLAPGAIKPFPIYFVKPVDPVPDYRLLLTFMFGDFENFDIRSDRNDPADRNWSYLYVRNTNLPEEAFRVDCKLTEPGCCKVAASAEHLAARAAWFLGVTTYGTVAEGPESEFIDPYKLLDDHMGDFDRPAAWTRMLRSPFRKGHVFRRRQRDLGEK